MCRGWTEWGEDCNCTTAPAECGPPHHWSRMPSPWECTYRKSLRGENLTIPSIILWQVDHFSESQNHRITECSGLEETSVGHLIQFLCRSRVAYSRLHRTLCRRVLNISREGDSTTSLGSLFQGSITLRVKKFFLTFRRNFLCFSLCPKAMKQWLCLQWQQIMKAKQACELVVLLKGTSDSSPWNIAIDVGFPNTKGNHITKQRWMSVYFQHVGSEAFLSQCKDVWHPKYSQLQQVDGHQVTQKSNSSALPGSRLKAEQQLLTGALYYKLLFVFSLFPFIAEEWKNWHYHSLQTSNSLNLCCGSVTPGVCWTRKKQHRCSVCWSMIKMDRKLYKLWGRCGSSATMWTGQQSTERMKVVASHGQGWLTENIGSNEVFCEREHRQT